VALPAKSGSSPADRPSSDAADGIVGSDRLLLEQPLTLPRKAPISLCRLALDWGQVASPAAAACGAMRCRSRQRRQPADWLAGGSRATGMCAAPWARHDYRGRCVRRKAVSRSMPELTLLVETFTLKSWGRGRRQLNGRELVLTVGSRAGGRPDRFSGSAPLVSRPALGISSRQRPPRLQLRAPHGSNIGDLLPLGRTSERASCRRCIGRAPSPLRLRTPAPDLRGALREFRDGSGSDQDQAICRNRDRYVGFVFSGDNASGSLRRKAVSY